MASSKDVSTVLKSAADFAKKYGPVAVDLAKKYGPEAVAFAKQYGPAIAAAAGSAVAAGGAAATKAGSAAKAAGEHLGENIAEAAAHLKEARAAKAGTDKTDAASEAPEASTSKAARGRKTSRRSSRDAELEADVARMRDDALESCSYRASAADFKAAREADGAAGGEGGFMSLPGCYVILRMPSARTKSAAKFADVYVGASESMGGAVFNELVGMGNPDVYADFKYEQPQLVLLYPCEVDELAGLRGSLMLSLQAFASYNARELHALEAGGAE